MSVEWQDAFNILMMVAVAMGGWILGRISKTLDRLDDDMRNLPVTYVTKLDYREDTREIKEALHRIESKMDGKADK